MLLGGLQLDQQKNSSKIISNDLVMEAVQAVQYVPPQWVCPVECELYP